MTDLDWVAPDACTLPTADQPLRVAEFDALFAAGFQRAAYVGPAHARLELIGPDPDVLANRVADLTVRETACCSFFDFDVRIEDPATVVLDVRVPPARVDVLEALVGRARSIAEGRA